MVRVATHDDVHKLVQLAQVEHARSRFASRKFDRYVSHENMSRAVDGMLSRVFISEAGLGFLAGVLQPSLFNKYFTAYELCWYAEDGSGIDLLRSFCGWAKDMSALDVVVSNYAGMVPSEQFTRVMGREGFSVLGTTYTKSLEAKD